MFSDYTASIVADYHQQKTKGTLSLNLMNPTPSCIKNELLIVLEGRTKKEELKTLRLFFGERENEGEYERAIRNAEVDIFKPLSNFLKGKTTKTEEKNIELLAWLIDFSPRPYTMDFNRPDVKPPVVQTTRNTNQETEPLSESDSKGIRRAYKGIGGKTTAVDGTAPGRAIKLWDGRNKISIILFVLIVGAVVLAMNRTSVKGPLSFLSGGNKQCMYWSGEQYLEADCAIAIPNAELVALNRYKLDNFRKIKQPDTLNESHVNKVWYLKTGNKLELFTMEGKHPEQLNKRLHPLSKYMLGKYVRTGKVNVD